MNLKKIMATVVALAMVLSSMGMIAFAETVTEVSTAADLKTAVEAGKSVKLTADITTDSALEISGKTVSIDLNEKTLKLGAGDNKFIDASTITISNGTINIDGLTVGGNAAICLDEYEETLVTTLTLNDVDVVGENYSSAYCVFYIGDSSVLNVNGGNWILKNDLYEDGGVFKSDTSAATLNISGATMDFYNVRRGVIYTNTTIENSQITIKGDEETSKEMEHGFNRSPLSVVNSTITMENLFGRGITAECGAVTIDATSKVTMQNCVEATIDVRNNQTFTIEEGAKVVIDKEATVASGAKIDGTVEIGTPVEGEVKIGDTPYATLAEAVQNVKTGETITLLTDVTENEVVIETNNVEFTIDGNDNSFTGCLALGIGEKLTVKNVDFVATSEVSPGYFIDSMDRNSNVVLTVQDCTFTDTDYSTAAIGTHQPTKVIIDGCTTNGVHSLLQNQGGYNITVKNSTINGKRGMALGTVVGATVDNVTINADDNKYGIRLDGEITNNTITIKNSRISAFIPVVVRDALVENYSIVFEGTNTMTPANTDGLWCAIGASEYETNGTMPTAPTGKVTVTLNDTGLDAEGVYGEYEAPAVNYLAKIGDTSYETVAAALAAAQEASMTDVTITLCGETTKESAIALEDTFNLYTKNGFNSVTFKQEDPSKVYYIDSIYTGSRTNGGECTFDGVNIVVTGQYIFEGNVKLTGNSVVKSVAEANCFVYNGTTTVELGSKLQGVIEDIRSGALIIDGGRTDGAFNETPDMQDAIIIINWSGDSMTLKNGAYFKVNAANEIGTMTVNAGTNLNVYDSKLDAWQWIANNGTINTDVNSLITTGTITGTGVINIDASDMAAEEVLVIDANMSGFNGIVNVTGNDNATYEITDDGIVVSQSIVVEETILKDAVNSKAQASGLMSFTGETSGIKWCSYKFIVDMTGKTSIGVTVEKDGAQTKSDNKTEWVNTANIESDVAFGVAVTGLASLDTITVDVQ